MKPIRLTLMPILLTYASFSHAGAIGFAIGFTDTGDPTSIQFIFGTPIVPITGLASWSATLSGSCTDAGENGCSATFVNSAMVEFSSGLNLIAALGDNLVGAAGGVTNYGPINQSGLFDCGVIAGGCTSLTAELYFQGSGLGDEFAFNGSLEIEPYVPSVPEPAPLVLLALGLLGLGSLRLRLRSVGVSTA